MSRSVALPDGARIAFADSGEGSGPPVVFLHAFPLHSAMWSPQVEALAGRRRCVTPDARGFGGSTAGSARLTIDRMADDVAALLDALAIERAVLVGLSMGGYAALAALRRHRDRIAALLLADTRAAADSDEARAKREALIALAREEGSDAVAAKQVVGLLGKTTRRRDPELVERVERLIAEAAPESIVAGAEALRDRPDATPLLPTTGRTADPAPGRPTCAPPRVAWRRTCGRWPSAESRSSGPSPSAVSPRSVRRPSAASPRSARPPTGSASAIRWAT